MKKGLKIVVVAALALALLTLTGFCLYRHFVTNQIMAGDGGSGTLQIELELPDGTEETVALQKIKE